MVGAGKVREKGEVRDEERIREWRVREAMAMAVEARAPAAWALVWQISVTTANLGVRPN